MNMHKCKYIDYCCNVIVNFRTSSFNGRGRTRSTDS